MVMCVEVTDDSHPGSVRAQPLFIDLAREVSQIPFFQVKLGGFGRSHDEVCTTTFTCILIKDNTCVFLKKLMNVLMIKLGTAPRNRYMYINKLKLLEF